jgi:glycine/D-amino acid oxidase-like deaminating enzyme
MEDPVLLRMNLFSVRWWLELQRWYSQELPGGDEETLFYKRTGAMMGGPTAAIHHIADVVCRELGERPEAECEILDHRGAMSRFPQLQLNHQESLIYMPHGYTIVVNTCIESLKRWLDKLGVERVQTSVERLDRRAKIVVTSDGEEHCYQDLVITSGPWTNRVLSAAGLSGMPLVVSNEQTVELRPCAGAPSHDWGTLPVYTWSEAGYKGRNKDGGCRYFYTTPHVGLQTSGSEGVKIGYHRQGPLLDNDEFQVTDLGRSLRRMLPHDRKDLVREQQYDLDEYALEAVRDFVREKMPHLDADNPAGYMRCLYQMTPDMNMVVGRHPEDPSVVLACGFSGSGFQFAPAIGDLLAELIVLGPGAPQPKRGGSDMHHSMLDKFTPDRFARFVTS